ncbi:fanconi-associated nuclease 1 [Ascaphus truei]|uniref:fanconi-associated nuclease 1 n=1 Tax=Ascaphus truei TaxID=8439 RepID=UPI003F5A90D1
MSQIKSPEKKKSRKSLSLSKKRSNVTQKNQLLPNTISKSQSIVALFKNAPPAKLSCPLCGEMVPRFGLNKHLDEACPKEKQDGLEDDVILVDEASVQSNIPCMSPKPSQEVRGLIKTDLNMSPCVQTDVSVKPSSPYFNKDLSVKDIFKETQVQIGKTVPLESLSSKLSRRYQTRSVKRDTRRELQCQVAAAECIEIPTEGTSDVRLSTLREENLCGNTSTQPKILIRSGETENTNNETLATVCANHNNSQERNNALICGHVIEKGPKSPLCSDKYLSPGSPDDKLVDCSTETRKHKIEDNIQRKTNRCKKAKHSVPEISALPAASLQQCDELTVNSPVKDNAELLPMEDLLVLNEFLKPFDDTDYQGEEENLQHGIDGSSVQEECGVHASRHPYYLRNFLMVLQTVMESEEDMNLFSEEDIRTLTAFHELSAGSQKLYVRLFQRKLNWIKINKIEYTEIGSDLVPFVEELVQNGFLQSDSELQELSEALDLFPAPDLKTLAKGFHLANPGAQKQQLVEEFLRLSKQRSIFSMGKNQPGIAAVILKKAKYLCGRAVRVCRAPRAVFSRVLLLFSLTDSMEVEEAASGGQTQLSTVLMVNMGRTTFPTYTVNRTTQIFQDREDLIRYEAAMHKLIEVIVTMTNGNWEEAHLLYQSAGKEWDGLKNEPSLSYHAELPVYLRCFTVGWVYTKILSRGVEILQRLHMYEEAVQLLQRLLSQHIYCPDSRGRWWDRLALNLHQHLKHTQKAIDFIMEGLSDPYVRTGHQLSLYQRAVRMRDSPSCKKFRHLLRDLPVMAVEDVPHVTIKGRMYPQTGMGKSVFLMEDLADDAGEDIGLSTVMCSVEELALAHYRQQGFDQGIHGEGSTFCTLYGLLMWDVIFMEGVPDVFRNSYQAFPLDLYTDNFLENRRDAIESRLQLLHGSSTETLAQLIADVWNAHEGKAAALVSWERFSSLQQAQNLVSCFGGAFSSGVCQRMSKDIRHCRGGLPDLVVWNTQKKQYKLVEVKGPSDRLSHKQMVWLHELKKLGADVEVCHVVSIGAKSNRVG